MLLISEDVPKAIVKIVDAYNKKDISEARLAHSVKKILMAKYKVGLSNYTPIGMTTLVDDLNRLEDDLLYEELLENAVTVLKNKSALLPFRNLEIKKNCLRRIGR